MSTVKSRIFTGKDSLTHLSKFLSANSNSQTFVLVDENTLKHCYPKIKKLLPKHIVIQIKSGEKNKTLATCELVWNKLTDENADRKILLINLGGGVIGDLGGFAAGCYKRGIKFINIPTTLLAMVDASVGAKTGVDFNGFKNQIGLFNEPEAVFIHTGFLKTLPERELRAGLAEVIKHYLIADKKAFKELFDLIFPKQKKQFDIRKLDFDALVEKNIAIKSKIVAKDKFETAERKALNFGHTVGHAVETYFLNKGKDILHGEAVAIGLLCESRISFKQGSLLKSDYWEANLLVSKIFPGLPFLHKRNIPTILKLMKQDKKNASGQHQFTLLNNLGKFSINNSVDESVIIDSLEYYSELYEEIV
jgi:3-dehydroquinate synthase